MPARVSVVIPCYNYGHYLVQSVISVLEQPEVSVDVIIVDDASTDGSADVADRLAQEDDRVRVIKHEVNQGHIATYNEGLDLVEGEYCVLLSSDDALTPGALSRAVALMSRHPQVGLVYGNPVVFEEELKPARTRPHSWSVWRGETWIRAQCRRGLSCIYSPEAVARTSVQRHVGGYQALLPKSGDLEMWLRFAAVGDIGRVNGVDQAYRRVHKDSMMMAYDSPLVDLIARQEAYDTFFAAIGGGRASMTRHWAIARRRLAAEALELVCDGLSNGRPVDGVDEYLAFARQSADVTQLASWREYQRRVHRPPGAGMDVRAVAGGMVRDLAGRWRWRRWKYCGV